MPLFFLPVLAQAFSVIAGDASEVRARVDGTGQFVDMTTTGRIALDLKLRRTTWTLFYAPSVTQLGLGSSTSILFVTHTGGLTTNLRLSPRTSLTLSETGTYGQQNFRTLAVSAPPPTLDASATAPGSGTGQPPQTNGTTGPAGTANLAVPGSRTISFGTVTVGAGVNHVLDRNWSTGVFASYTPTKELDSYTPVTIPTSRTLLGNIWLMRTLGRRDQLVLTETGRYTVTEPTAEAIIATTNIAWNHRLSFNAGTSLFATESYVNSTDLLGNHSKGIMPGAGATLTLHDAIRPAGARLTTTMTVMFAPVVDYQFGGINDMLTGVLGVNWTRKRLTFRFMGAASRSIGSYGQVNLLSMYGLTEAVIYQLDRRHWAITAGMRQAWQQFAVGQQLPPAWVAFVGLSYTTGAVPL